MRVKQTIKKIFEITLGALFVVVGISQAFGMGRHAFVFSILRKAAFEIPFILIFSKVFGLCGLAYSACCAEILMAIIAGFVLKKLMQKIA